MPRRQVIFNKDSYYHIYNRGANRERIFFNKDNYIYLLGLMKKHFRRGQASPIAYSLIPNHYHFLLRQDGDVSLSSTLGNLFNAYVLAVNRQQGRTGTLFEGRFEAIHVNEENYLIHLCRYIHANPVKAGLVADPGDWPYSNYLEWVGERPGTLVDHEFVEMYFPTETSRSFESSGRLSSGRLSSGRLAHPYREFVLEYLRDIKTLPEDIKRYLFEE
ncbi:MAG: transposase [Anaerolineae bacterium]|nr:transposase [Anaerolineae bacterium]